MWMFQNSSLNEVCGGHFGVRDGNELYLVELQTEGPQSFIENTADVTRIAWLLEDYAVKSKLQCVTVSHSQVNCPYKPTLCSLSQSNPFLDTGLGMTICVMRNEQ